MIYSYNRNSRLSTTIWSIPWRESYLGTKQRHLNINDPLLVNCQFIQETAIFSGRLFWSTNLILMWYHVHVRYISIYMWFILVRDTCDIYIFYIYIYIHVIYIDIYKHTYMCMGNCMWYIYIYIYRERENSSTQQLSFLFFRPSSCWPNVEELFFHSPTGSILHLHIDRWIPWRTTHHSFTSFEVVTNGVKLGNPWKFRWDR